MVSTLEANASPDLVLKETVQEYSIQGGSRKQGVVRKASKNRGQSFRVVTKGINVLEDSETGRRDLFEHDSIDEMLKEADNLAIESDASAPPESPNLNKMGRKVQVPMTEIAEQENSASVLKEDDDSNAESSAEDEIDKPDLRNQRIRGQDPSLEIHYKHFTQVD